MFVLQLTKCCTYVITAKICTDDMQHILHFNHDVFNEHERQSKSELSRGPVYDAMHTVPKHLLYFRRFQSINMSDVYPKNSSENGC